LAIRRIRTDHIGLSLIKRSETQARQAEINTGIDDLAASIARQGLLLPISLVELKENEEYELIDGQRRFLAYQELGKESPNYSKIYAVIYENTMEDWEKKTISVNANITQQPMKDGDKINAITSLYNHFGGNISEVARSTGLSKSTIRKYVKFVRLPEVLKKMVENNETVITVALETADMYEDTDVDNEIIRQTALELSKLQRKQREKVVQRAREDPREPVNEIVRKVQHQKQKGHQITVTVLSDTYEKIDKFKAQNKNPTIEGAVEDLIEDGIKANDL